MKCKAFKVHLQNDFDESKLNEFLENVNLNQVFASIVTGETPFWSILILYEDKTASSEKPRNTEPLRSENILTPELSKPTAPKKEIATPDFTTQADKLTAEQENSYNALRNWRNERAGQDGIPPYLIAHNDSLMQMALASPKTLEDLLQIKGLGEKRVQKYGDEILQIMKPDSE